MIRENIQTDWLDKINGRTIAEAVEYLQTLDQTYKLTAYPDGEDLHGVEQYSGLYYERKETEAELITKRLHYLNNKKKDTLFSIAFKEKEIEHGYNVEHHSRSLVKTRETLAAIESEIISLNKG